MLLPKLWLVGMQIYISRGTLYNTIIFHNLSHKHAHQIRSHPNHTKCPTSPIVIFISLHAHYTKFISPLLTCKADNNNRVYPLYYVLQGRLSLDILNIRVVSVISTGTLVAPHFRTVTDTHAPKCKCCLHRCTRSH